MRGLQSASGSLDQQSVFCEQEAVLTALPVRAAKAIRTAVTLALLFWLWGKPSPSSGEQNSVAADTPC